MEIGKLCFIRDIYKEIGDFGQSFNERYDIGLNEVIALCALTEGRLSSGDLAEKLGLTNSNTSKVIKLIEQKGYVERILGETDKRQMYFKLTEEGRRQIGIVRSAKIQLPELLEELLGLRLAETK